MTAESDEGATLVIREGALGDFVLTLPVIRALTTLGPVYVSTNRRYAPLLPPGAAHLATVWPWHGAQPPIAFLRAVAFSPTTVQKLCGTGIPVVRGAALRPESGEHAVDHFGAILAGLGHAEAAFDRRPRVEVAPDRAARGRIVIAPGSGGREKRWPLDRWRAVAARLPAPPIWVRGPDEHEEDGWPADAICPELPALAALAAGCAAWLGPDSGPSHLAAAVGCPAVGVVFGPTDPAIWAPVGASVWPWDVDPVTLASWAVAFVSVPVSVPVSLQNADATPSGSSGSAR